MASPAAARQSRLCIQPFAYTRQSLVKVGPPLGYGTVTTGPLSANATLPVFGTIVGTATSLASITGGAGPAGNGVTLVGVALTTATGLGDPTSMAYTATDPFTLTPLASPTSMTVEINLNPDPSDYPGGTSFQALSSDNTEAIATSSLSLDITTNIPDLATVMSMTITDSSVSGISVSNWCSPVLAQPFTASDFTADSNGV